MARFNKVGIAGAGAMGTGIAQLAAQAGHHVVVFDSFPGALSRGSEGLDNTLSKLTEKGKLTAEQANAIGQRTQWTNQLSDLKDCDLVIEAIIEDKGIKQKLYQELEDLVSGTCVIASNTSSITLTSLAAGLTHPERFCGLHFFNPAPVMQLVEVIPALQTSVDLPGVLYQLMLDWGKKPAMAKDTPGFIVNRIARPYYGEALRIYDEGLANATDIDLAMKTLGGFRMGPFELMDFIGHDVNYRVTESVFQAMYNDPRYKPSLSQKTLLDAGWLGRKSGKGFYTYPEQKEIATFTSKITAREIFDRIFAMLVNEAVDAVYYRVCTPEDADLAMQYGANYPNGLISWGKAYGLHIVTDTINQLFQTYQEDRYRLSRGFNDLQD